MKIAKGFASKLAMWLVFASVIAFVCSAHEWGPEILRIAGAMAEDPAPGSKVQPTPDQIQKAHHSAMRRRSD